MALGPYALHAEKENPFFYTLKGVLILWEKRWWHAWPRGGCLGRYQRGEERWRRRKRARRASTLPFCFTLGWKLQNRPHDLEDKGSFLSEFYDWRSLDCNFRGPTGGTFVFIGRLAHASSIYRTCNTLLITPNDLYHKAKMSESKLNTHQVSRGHVSHSLTLSHNTKDTPYKLPLIFNSNYWLIIEWNQKQHALDWLPFCQRHLVN